MWGQLESFLEMACSTFDTPWEISSFINYLTKRTVRNIPNKGNARYIRLFVSNGKTAGKKGTCIINCIFQYNCRQSADQSDYQTQTEQHLPVSDV
jgi:hypothetical protein